MSSTDVNIFIGYEERKKILATLHRALPEAILSISFALSVYLYLGRCQTSLEVAWSRTCPGKLVQPPAGLGIHEE